MNYWDELIKMRDEQRSVSATGAQVVRGSELPLEKNGFGRLRWYMHPAKHDTALSTFVFYEQIVAPGGRSGRLRFQGGNVIYVLAGSGHTWIDGVKHPWRAGSLLTLPLKRDGIVIQHFNTGSEDARLIAVEPNLFACTTVDRGSGFELLEPAPAD